MASRMDDEMRRQRKCHTKRTATNPQSHTGARRAGNRWIRLKEAVEAVVRETIDIVGCVKGWPTSSIAKYSSVLVPLEPSDHARWLPTATSTENGIRNFTDAASQSQ
jgi:hypothetical protein